MSRGRLLRDRSRWFPLKNGHNVWLVAGFAGPLPCGAIVGPDANCTIFNALFNCMILSVLFNGTMFSMLFNGMIFNVISTCSSTA